MRSIHQAITALVIMLCGTTGFAQGIWSDDSQTSRITDERLIVPASSRTLHLDLETLESWMRDIPHETEVSARNSSFILDIPLPDGTMEQFSIVEAPVMAQELTDRYPNFRSYAGQGINDQTATLRFCLTHKGFNGMVMSSKGSFYIDPYSPNTTELYISYWRSEFYKTTTKVFDELPPISSDMNMDVQKYDNSVESKYKKPVHNKQVRSFGQRAASGSELRTYRLALAGTGEYVAFHGGTVPDGMAAMVVSMTRVNGVYEREVAIRMVMVANNDLLVYTNGGTDPYTNGNGGTMLGENINTCNSVIGSGNYDIGHVFSTGGGGVAYLYAPCGGNKAGGVTGLGAPVGDPFDIDYVCHEMGHQFGGNHTQNNDCNRSAGAAYEPGSAATIMGYAGICSPNLQTNSDDYFHNHSYNEIINFSVNGNGNTCATITNTSNGVPTVTVGADGFTIPHSTPFELTPVSANDPDGDALTYCWEEYDLGPATAAGDANLTNPSGTQTTFRSWKGTADDTRIIPLVDDLVNNTTTIGEHIPDYTRAMSFKCTVRDNRAGGGGVNDDLWSFNMDGNSGPFLVLSPNTAGLTYLGNSIQTITWDVAGTDNAPVNCASVNIYLSTDGGYTFPTLLVSNTTNDGSQDVLIPAGETSTARIKVKASNNIFFDISNTNFIVGPSAGANDYDAGITNIAAPAGDYCSSSVSPEVTIINFGIQTLTSFDLTYDVDGGTSTVFNWTGSISTGSSTTINLASISAPTGAHLFNVIVSNPNGFPDENLSNNSGTSAFSTVSGGSTATLTILTDCWGEEVSWNLSDAGGTVIESQASNTLADQTINTWDWCLASGCYDIEILDDFGDGLSGIASGCAIDGDYSIVDEFGTVLVQMGAANYGSGITHNFCVPVGTPGCIDTNACNFDSLSTVDDGSCTFPGCTNSGACNYDAAAGCDDSSCEFLTCLGCITTTACNYDSTATIDDGSCEFLTCTGCITTSACNYDSTATLDDGSCEFLTCAGCITTTACNYDSTATLDDGSCEFLTCAGCMTTSACNYDSTATVDDGSCTSPGCSIIGACNWSPFAGCDDGSCVFPGCQDLSACNYDSLAGCNDGSCEFPGCIDTAACNYSASAACDDGSCTYPGCNDMNACNYDSTAGCDDGSCSLPGCINTGACNYDSTAGCDDGTCEFTSCAGCLDTEACNFNSTATIDDGSCAFPGCMDTTACNYDSTAGCDDGSCEFTSCGCPGDFDSSGIVDVQDLLLLLGDFGCVSSCTTDLNSDGVVNSQDILIFLGYFGAICD
jgi:hypothetical protein